ncbi:MAG: hypothetical protein M0Z58_07100, partial [Nitrospiraceae bacterium]|nr:hypothetical protein [Nitrospiraceae bacterium]
SIAGALIAMVALMAIVFIFAITVLTRTRNPYVGIILYLGLPFFFVLGLLIIPVGMYRRWRRLKKGEEFYPKWPSIDLNIKEHRNAAMIFIFGTAFFVLINSVGVYRTYQFMESVSFCGLVCHKVMAPEYTTFKHSPHARLKCVQCHIGPGAGWYTKSKLSGLYQVCAVLANKYPRPIPAPIKNLRPVEIDCDQCHWREHFPGRRGISFVHYLYDKTNTRWVIDMLLNTGAAAPSAARAGGIHWHMSPAVKVEYIARDRQRQDIPWVRFTDRKTGRVTVYQDVTNPLSKKEVAVASPGVMGCIDCHDTPSHIFHSPDRAIDLALAAGLLDPSIPEIKQVAASAMAGKYRSRAEAGKLIETAVTGFYAKRYRAFFLGHGALISNAAAATRRAYMENVFPGMRTDWRAYPDDSGHFIYPGCMRCHDGNHKSADGRVIPNGCETCHVILFQGSGESVENGGARKTQCPGLRRGLPFRHPVDIGGAWKTVPCFDCHRGVRP